MAFAAHSEMGESSEVIAACSETNFAVQLFKKFFKDKEIIKKKFSGANGKEPLPLSGRRRYKEEMLKGLRLYKGAETTKTKQIK